MLSTYGFFGIALFIGALPLAIKSSQRIRLYHKSKNWPKVKAVIVKSSLRESTDSEGTSFKPEFSYLYSIAGIEYNSTKHTEGLPFQNSEETARKMVQNLPVGTNVEVAVNPTDPKYSVLDTGFPKGWQALFQVSIVALIAGFAIVFHEAVF